MNVHTSNSLSRVDHLLDSISQFSSTRAKLVRIVLGTHEVLGSTNQTAYGDIHQLKGILFRSWHLFQLSSLHIHDGTVEVSLKGERQDKEGERKEEGRG